MRRNGWEIRVCRLLWLASLISVGCARQIVSLDVTTEPSGAKVVFASIDAGIIRAYTSPANIAYDPVICHKPSLTIESPGYTKKVIRVQSKSWQQKFHVVLEKTTETLEEQEKSAHPGVPEQLGQDIQDWIPNISAETPAFDPTHR